MSNQTKGSAPQPYGMGGRKMTLPVKATSQIWQASMVAQISGACVVGTTAGAGNCVGVAEHDQLGGASDGSTRVSVLTDQIFLFKNGANAVSDATPIGMFLYMEDDNSVGTGGVLGSGEGVAGRFMGFQDDGRVRVFVSASLGSESGVAANGTAVADGATANVSALGRVTRYLIATESQNATITLVTTGAVVGDVIRVVRTDASAHTVAFVNGGVGAGTMATLVASKVGWFQSYFDGTNWLFDGCSAT
jgi:hypothetical protein